MMLGRLQSVCIAGIVGLLVGCVTVPTPEPVSTGLSLQYSYSSLSPHGSWLVSAEYGRVWQPSVYRGGWNPYYEGRWVYTDLGWCWDSDYEWGAIPYHYGTWSLDADLGWVWIPGTVWAPSWVVFRTGPDYIGWAPVPPRFRVGMTVRFDEPRSDLFVFVSSRDFLSPRIGTAVVRDSGRRTIINNTQIVNNITIENNVVVNRGLNVGSVERASGRRIREVRIEEVARAAPGGGRVDREQLRVDRRGSGKLQATEPIQEREQAPSRASGPENPPDPRHDAGTRRQRPELREQESPNRPERRRRSSGPELGPAEGELEVAPNQPDASEPPQDPRPPRTQSDEPRRVRPKERDGLHPRESGPGVRPSVDTPDDSRPPDEAKKPREKKRTPRQERKQKKEKGQKPDEQKPQQENDDSDKPTHGNREKAGPG